MPEKIGPYTVVSQLGRGGMGVVYKGRDESLNRFVAIKVLTENLSEDPTFLQRFVREAQAAASLSHPNVVQIYFTGQNDEGHPYFVMEYVAGRSLDHVLRSEGRIDNPRASQLMLQAAHGLAAAHDLGLVHRDIKPANLILDERGMVKIADFGLALAADAESRLTATGLFVGTPGYLSPEQCAGEKADHRSDIYALGVTYYMLLTGTPPFRGDSPLALIKQILDANPPDVTTINPNVDPESRRILAKMIAREPEQRYQSCHELVSDLENLLTSMGVRSMTVGLSTRTPVSSAAALAAMSAPTAIVSAEALNAAAPPAAEVTHPELPMTGQPTSPAIQQPASQPAAIQAPVIRKGMSTSTLLIAALLAFVLLAGGAVAAVMFAKRVFRNDTPAKLTAEAAPAGSGETVASPPQEALLSQAIVTAPLATSDQAGQTSSSSDAASATTQQVWAAQAPTASAVNPPREAQPGTARPAQPATSAAIKEIAPVLPTRQPNRRALSGVAVAATGDQALLGAVSSVLRAESESAGLEAVNAHDLPSTEDMLQGRVAVRDLIAELRDDGYAVLMLARIEPTGQRELSYHGRRDTAYTARVTVTPYDLATGRPFGSPQSAEIRYTSINVESESQDVVGPLARSAANAIRERKGSR
jgi:eukaryotic-like serine/threonine-protein kinase